MPTVNLFFDTRKTAQSEGIIKISVTHQRKQRLYSTGIKATPDQWKQLPRKGEKIDERIKDNARLKLYSDIYSQPNGFYRRAEAIIEVLGMKFDFDVFKERFDLWDGTPNGGERNVILEQNNVFAALHAKAAAMHKDDRISNAEAYGHAAKSLSRYVANLDDHTRKELNLPPMPKANKRTQSIEPPVFRFEHLTPELLTDYESWMLNHGKSPKTVNSKNGNIKASGTSITTVGIYLRHLRAVVNDAIEADIMPLKAYPFGRNKYVIPKGNNIKKAITKKQVADIMRYECQSQAQQRARDLWVFSYLTNGINMADVCGLRWCNIDRNANQLSFVRQKTARSKKSNQVSVSAKLFTESWAIIKRQGNQDHRPTAYVFPFLSNTMDAQQQRNTVRQVIKTTNYYMKQVGVALGIQGDLNTYAARHSFATILLQSSVPVAFISQSLGHSDIKTTQSYLGNFDDQEVQKYLNVLID